MERVADGGFTAGEILTPGLEFRNHAIHVNQAGYAGLAMDGQRIDGFFMAFEGGDLLIYRDTTKGQFARNGRTNTSIAPGDRVVGAEKDIAGKPLGGYVRGIGELANNADAATVRAYLKALFNACNNIVRPPTGAATYGATDYPPADVVVELGVASSD